MTQLQKERVTFIIKSLSKIYPNPQTPLFHRNIFELFVAVLLSAQMQDARLNKILPKLFDKFPTAKAFANAKLENIENALKGVNYYKTKAKHLKQACQIIISKFKGKVPNNLNDLLTLPGVGKKTANVILNEGFNIPSGIVVDTHVKRVAYRLGLTKNTDPKHIEEDLKAIVPKKYWRNFSLWLIFHGRNTCTARKPKCDNCPLKEICPFAKKHGE